MAKLMLLKTANFSFKVYKLEAECNSKNRFTRYLAPFVNFTK